MQQLKLAILPLDVSALEQALYLPAGYKIVAVHYNEVERRINLALTSDELPEVQDGIELPTAMLLVTVHQLPDHPGYRRYTTEVKL